MGGGGTGEGDSAGLVSQGLQALRTLVSLQRQHLGGRIKPPSGSLIPPGLQGPTMCRPVWGLGVPEVPVLRRWEAGRDR